MKKLKVNTMKLRMTVVLVFALAAWLPAVAHESSGSQAEPVTDANAKQATGTSCDHKGKDHSCCHRKDAKANGKSCCESKDGNAMACCQEHAKGDQTAANCCSGKDDKMCAKHGKSCRGKDAVAGNAKDGKNCCGGTPGDCPGCTHS